MYHDTALFADGAPRVGWRLAGEDDQFFYVVLPLNDADEQR
jgi:hypothetical protein